MSNVYIICLYLYSYTDYSAFYIFMHFTTIFNEKFKKKNSDHNSG